MHVQCSLTRAALVALSKAARERLRLRLPSIFLLLLYFLFFFLFFFQVPFPDLRSVFLRNAAFFFAVSANVDIFELCLTFINRLLFLLLSRLFLALVGFLLDIVVSWLFERVMLIF